MYQLLSLNPNFPISFGIHQLPHNSHFIPHWHENIEILHILKGNAKFYLDATEGNAQVGDTIIVNSNTLHKLTATDGELVYYCLIVSIEFLQQFGINLSEISLKNKIKDMDAKLILENLSSLDSEKSMYYTTEMCGDVLRLISILTRKHTIHSSKYAENKKNTKTDIVKKTISYMKKNYEKNITLEDISSYLSFNKSYICRIFKDITGITIVKMLNSIRCREAKRLIVTNKYTVSEAAQKCGFSNLSYFTKTYKHIMGHLPSQIKS